MASTYPGSIDSLARASSGHNLGTTPHSKLHNDAADAITAVQTTLGTNPQGNRANVADRFDNLSAVDVGARPDDVDVPWGDLTGVPGSFTPSAHTHAWADITDPVGMDDLSDVDTSGVSTGDVLMWTGSAWEVSDAVTTLISDMGDVEGVLDAILEGTL